MAASILDLWLNSPTSTPRNVSLWSAGLIISSMPVVCGFTSTFCSLQWPYRRWLARNQGNKLIFCFVHLHQRLFKTHCPILNLSSSRKLLNLFFMKASDCNIMNPGPIKFPHGICSRPVKCNQRAIECEECQSRFHLNCIAMSVQSYSDYNDNDDSKLVWLCNMSVFPNCSTSFLLRVDFSSENRFESLASEGDSRRQPSHTSSPSSAGAHHHERMKSTNRRLKFFLMNCNGLKSNSKKAAFNSFNDWLTPTSCHLGLWIENWYHPFLHTLSFLILTRSTVKTDRYQEVACLLQPRRALSQWRILHLTLMDVKLLEFQYSLPDWKNYL